MRIPSYLQRSRHGIYYFRIVVPKGLRETFDGQGEIKRSLRTRNLREAMRMARPLALQAYEIFDALGPGMSKTEPSIESILANKDKQRELKVSETVVLPNGVQHTYTVETDDPAELPYVDRIVAQQQRHLREKVRPYTDQEPVSPEIEARRAKEREELEQGLAALEAERAAQVQTVAPVAPATPTPAPAAPATNPDNILSKRWREYAAQKDGNDWSTSRTVKANQRMFQTFMDWWQQDGDMSSVNREAINKFITYLITDKEVEAGKRRGERGMDKRTADNHIMVLNKFLAWAQDKGYYPDERRLPTANQLLVKKKARKRAAAKANVAYTLAQLQTLFDPEHYKPEQAHHFWPPLIALFTGARRREIAQLLLSDFYEKDGIQAMSINIQEDEDKSVKSEAAIREIPIHPTLIELGLLDYLADAKAANLGPELFPGIGVNSDGEKGNAIGNFWGRYRTLRGITGGYNPTFHSFRATALKELQEGGVDLEMRCQLAGHEFDHVSKDYNNIKFPLSVLMEEGIPKLRYAGLDLSGLKYRRGQFDRASRIATAARIKREKIIAAKNKDKKQEAAEAREALAKTAKP